MPVILGRGGGGGGNLVVDVLPPVSEASIGTQYTLRSGASYVAYARPVPAVAASLTTAAYDTSAALASLTGTFLGANSVHPPIPSATGIYTYYNTAIFTWQYVVVPFQTSWQSLADSDIGSGRDWLVQTNAVDVVTHLDSNYDATESYSYYDLGLNTVRDILTYTATVAAVPGSLTERNFATADVTLGNYFYLGAADAHPTTDINRGEIYYNTSGQRFRYHNAGFTDFVANTLLPTEVGFGRWLGHLTSAGAVSALDTTALDTSVVTGYYDTGSTLVKIITAHTATVAAVPGSVTTEAYDGSDAFADLDGDFEGAASSAPTVPTDAGTYTYYDSTAHEWGFIVTPFMTAWGDGQGDANLASGRDWLTDRDGAAIAADFEANGYDSSLSYAYYDSAASSLYDIASYTAEAPETTTPDYVASGGLFRLGPETNEFTGATKAAAETARDTYATANAAWLAEYNDDLSAYIKLTYGTTISFQARNFAGTGWEDVTGLIQGEDGGVGAQGRFPLVEHANGSTTPTVAGGGSYNLATRVFTPSTGATAGPTAPASGEDVYAREAYVDPQADTGTVDLSGRWSAWVERSHLSAGISHVEVTAGDFTGSGISGDPIALDSARTFEANPTADATGSLLKVMLGGVVYDVDEIVDVTSVGLPPITEDNHRSLWIDFDTPRVWVGHRQSLPGTPAGGTFDDYAATHYHGALVADPPPPTNAADHYYNRYNHNWRGQGTVGEFPPRVEWVHRSFSSIFGANAVWLGEQLSDQFASNLIDNFDTANSYYYFNTRTNSVELLGNSTYTAPGDPHFGYTAEPISAPTGVGTITGITVSGGVVGGGFSGVVNISFDVTDADFPTIPVDKGGTGAVDAAAARNNLGISGVGPDYHFAIPNSGVGGTGNAITLTTGQSLTTLLHGYHFFFNSGAAGNTGAMTVNVDGIGATSLRKSNGVGGSTPMESGDITPAVPVLVRYDTQEGTFYLAAGWVGTASFRNTGADEGDVPVLGTGGIIAEALLPAELGAKDVIRVPFDSVGGTADAITLATGRSLSAFGDGLVFVFPTRFGANTGNVTLTIDTANARSVRRADGSHLLPGQLQTTEQVLVIYNDGADVFNILGTGNAGYYGVGTAEGQIPLLGTGGRIPADLLPTDLAGGFTLRVGDDAPDDSIGQDGDWYIARTPGTFSRKNAGAWVVQYTDKLGMAGTLDGTLLSGSGAPANALGANGDSYLDVDEGDFYKKASDAWALTFSAPWLNQNRVDARITNRIAPRIFVATAAFTQSISIIAFPVTPTTTDAPAIGDVVMVRTPGTVAASTGVALAMAIDGIGGSATYILDRSDGLGLNASELATNSIYMTVFDGTNFELVGQPLSPNVALLTGAVFNGITEGLDPTTAQGFVTRTHLDLQTPTYTASASSWDEASQTITLTLPVGSVVPGDEIIFLVPPVLTGQDDTAVQINVGGRTGTLRTFQSFTTLVLSRELVPREILLVQASGGDTYRMLEPHIVQRTGVWNSGRLYVLGQEATLNGVDYKLLTETSTNQNPETNPSVWLRFPHIWQDEGVSFTDPITGTNFVGDGVSSAVVGGVLTVTITGTSSPPPGDHNRYLALGDDALFTEADYTGGTVFTTDVVVFPTFTDASFPGVVVPADQPISTFTQLGAFEQDLTGFFNQIADIDIGGTNHHQWVGTQRFPNSYSGVRMRLS